LPVFAYGDRRSGAADHQPFVLQELKRLLDGRVGRAEPFLELGSGGQVGTGCQVAAHDLVPEVGGDPLVERPSVQGVSVAVGHCHQIRIS
jgi:hypothetical protein